MNTRTIQLSQGKETIVDADDYDYLMQWKWCYAGGYAVRQQTVSDGKVRQRHVKMHRVVNNTPKDMQTDHINLDKLDNRKSNLRTVTSKQNVSNRGGHANSTSGYKGVWWSTQLGRWTVFAWVEEDGKRKRKSGGVHEDKHEAARAYDKLARELHGEYAYQNFK